MIGRIIKIVSNDYTVKCEDENIYICKARGVFRNKKITPVVGDFCIISDQNYILDILPRKNFLIRPLVSNIDQGLIVTSLKTPMFSTNLLDKLILIMEINKIEPIICITKEDLINVENYLNNNKVPSKKEYSFYNDDLLNKLFNEALTSIESIYKDLL